jgi:hypothetical protein
VRSLDNNPSQCEDDIPPDTEPAEATNAGTQSTTTTTPEPEQDGIDTNPVGRLMARLRKGYEAQAAKDAEGEQPAAEATPEPEKPKDEPASEQEPEKPEAKENAKLELEHARALSKVRELATDNAKLSKRAETAERELNALRTAGKGNPLKVLEQLAGDTFANIMQRASKGEFDAPSAPQLPPEMEEKLKKMDAILEREAKREKEEQRKQAFAADLPKLKQFLADKATEFPLWTAFDDAAEELLSMVYDAQDKGENPNVVELLRQCEQEGEASLTEQLTNKKLVAHLAAKNPSIRSALTEALGLGKQPPQAAQPSKEPGEKSPRSVATPTEVLTRSTHEMTEEEEMAEAAKLWARRPSKTAGLAE